MEKGNNYLWSKIEQFALDNNYEIREYGDMQVGLNFLALVHNDKDLTISFIMTGTSGNECIYECIYSD